MVTQVEADKTKSASLLLTLLFLLIAGTTIIFAGVGVYHLFFEHEPTLQEVNRGEWGTIPLYVVETKPLFGTPTDKICAVEGTPDLKFWAFSDGMFFQTYVAPEKWVWLEWDGNNCWTVPVDVRQQYPHFDESTEWAADLKWPREWEKPPMWRAGTTSVR